MFLSDFVVGHPVLLYCCGLTVQHGACSAMFMV